MLKRLKAAVRGLGRRAAREALFSWYYPRLYRKAVKEPVTPGAVIFLDNKEGGLSDNFKVSHVLQKLRSLCARDGCGPICRAQRRL